jgi:hypothetical protein
MADSPWKNFERYISSIFQTTRNALSGGNSKITRSDSLHSRLFLSCKYTRYNYKTLRSLLSCERDKASKENKIAVCVIGEFDDRANAFVAIHLKDLHPFVKAIQDGEVSVNLVSDTQRPKPKRS